ncbi:hypothetical protein [Bacillus cereus]|uniref:hypothetical protein n=1 Tax=Bacillus cereus TaxID=1396 RepID=UPI001F45687B|nr:hypothetical protein [Bacillus cereus]BCC44645.1 hypothetical protein BCJMU01_p222 [Bacillus cereus]
MQNFSFEDANVIEDASQIILFSVHNQLEDDEVNSVTHYIYRVEIALEYTKEDKEIEIPVIVVETKNKAKSYRLPPELWEWGLEFARLKDKRPFEVCFTYIEETGLWEIDEVFLYKKW